MMQDLKTREPSWELPTAGRRDLCLHVISGYPEPSTGDEMASEEYGGQKTE